uniref:Nucleocapsid protein n=1 Tax=Dulem virus 34 TaxID=3145752 RepID=A0AAU8B502_9CAUD
MKLDKTFSRELLQINGDGSREAKFAFLSPAKAAARELSTPAVASIFPDVVRKYGRTAVAVCLASTILQRQDRLLSSTVQWAREVMRLWTNRPNNTGCVSIDDGLHPTRIEEYAGSFIRLTSEI